MMMHKIKLLSAGKKKAKFENLKNWEKTVERYAPDMYDLFYGAGEKDILNKVDELRPEIVLVLPSILQRDLNDGLRLLKEIHELHPSAAIFVTLGIVDDEQEAIDAFMAAGAYKCYAAPVIMDSLFHDMYVALNLD